MRETFIVQSQQIALIAKKASLLFVAIVLMASLVIVPATGRAVAASCITPLGDASTRTNIALTAYQAWKAKYVTSNGAGGDLRVQRSSFDGYDTVSEGIAYGMLFAVYANDKTTFDGLWAYAQKHVNGNGVMNWRIAADGSTAGYNGATDADEDIAAALIAADSTWGGYRAATLQQISVIKQHQIESGSNVVKPGDVWGGSSLLNPSYIAPSYYDIFQAYTGDARWAAVKSVGYQVLQASQNRTTGLIPDWSNSDGAPTNGMSYNYGYDASRAPLRLALSAAWSCDQSATALLAPFNSWSSKQNLTQLGSSYSLQGTIVDRGDATPLLAATAAAATVSTDATYRSTSWNALVAAPSTSYYPDSMRVFGLFVASGLIKSPMDLTQQQPAPVVSTSYAITSTNATVAVGSPTDIEVSFTAPQTKNNLLLDIEIYDANGTKRTQQVYEQQTLTTNAKKYSVRFTPQSDGAYTVKAGIFTAGWAENIVWNDKVSTVTANAIVVPPVTQPIPTPVPVVPTPVPPVIIPIVLPTQPVIPQPVITQPVSNLSIWWPGGTQAVSGVQPFKAVVDGLAVDQYEMFWQVDGGYLNQMYSIRDGAPHKLSTVDLQYWTWSANNRYTVTFVAKKLDGTVMAQKSTVITVAR